MSPAEIAAAGIREREVKRLRHAVADTAARGDIETTRALGARLAAAESALAAFRGAGLPIGGAL